MASVVSDLEKISQIKKNLFNSITSKNIVMPSDLPFEYYSNKVDLIESVNVDEVPMFRYYEILLNLKNYVFGGGVESSFGTQYFYPNMKLDNAAKGIKLSIGEGTFGGGGEVELGNKYFLNTDLADNTLEKIEGSPSVTNKAFREPETEDDPGFDLE